MAKRKIHLTFDDGPHPVLTSLLLSELHCAGIQATFFVLGTCLEQQDGKALIRLAASQGHQIGNHSYSHPDLTKLDEYQIREQILRTEFLIDAVDNGQKILRPPFGRCNSLVKQVASDLGYKIVLWDVDSLDYRSGFTQGRWVAHALAQIAARKQSIVLMHDILPTTVAHLRTLIEEVAFLPDTVFVPRIEYFPQHHGVQSTRTALKEKLTTALRATVRVFAEPAKAS